ncbi:hypothetical protein [Streptomyces sp. NPDC048269]
MSRTSRSLRKVAVAACLAALGLPATVCGDGGILCLQRFWRSGLTAGTVK